MRTVLQRDNVAIRENLDKVRLAYLCTAIFLPHYCTTITSTTD